MFPTGIVNFRNGSVESLGEIGIMPASLNGVISEGQETLRLPPPLFNAEIRRSNLVLFFFKFSLFKNFHMPGAVSHAIRELSNHLLDFVHFRVYRRPCAEALLVVEPEMEVPFPRFLYRVLLQYDFHDKIKEYVINNVFPKVLLF